MLRARVPVYLSRADDAFAKGFIKMLECFCLTFPLKAKKKSSISCHR